MALLGAVVSLVWLTCGAQSWIVLRRLTQELDRSHDRDEVEELVQKALPFKLIRPINLLAWFLPFLFLFSWAVTVHSNRCEILSWFSR
jgi:hypothetical protein